LWYQGAVGEVLVDSAVNSSWRQTSSRRVAAEMKVALPSFAPKWILRLWLLLMGRPIEFFSTLQLINSKFLTNIFQDHPVTAFQIIHSWPEQWKSNPTIRMRLVKWMTKHFGIQRDQYWLLQKLETPR